MAIGQDFYQNQGLTDIENLARSQSRQSLSYGDQAARYADPFMGERGKYQKQLSDLLANPGSFGSSPAYQFAYNQGLEALNRKGSLRSGNKMAELERYGQGLAGQQYFNQAKLLSDLAVSGSSPTAAGVSYERGVGRSQDQAQLAAAARNLGSKNNQSQQPSYMPAGGSALPTGGSSGGGSGGGSRGGYSNPYYSEYNYGAIDTPGQSGWINTANGSMPYTPSSMAGTGYISSDYGNYNFGTVAPNDSYYTPSYSNLGNLAGGVGYSDGEIDQFGLADGFDYGVADYGDWE